MCASRGSPLPFSCLTRYIALLLPPHHSLLFTFCHLRWCLYAAAQAALGRPRHRLLRCYATLHLAAVYAAYVGGLPGFGAALQPAGAEAALRTLGLWAPRVAPGMLPLLGLLLLVRGRGEGSSWGSAQLVSKLGLASCLCTRMPSADPTAGISTVP